MAAILLIALNQRQRRAPRVFRDRTNPLDYMDDSELIERYRMDRQSLLELCGVLNDDLEHPTHRSHAIPVSLQVLSALRFYAKGNFQSETADLHGLSRMSVSTCVRATTNALVNKLPQYISYPRDEASQNQIKQDFYKLRNFPHVLGAIDGTLIPIKAPPNDEHLFVCRKGYHALNIQGISDANGKFLDIVSKWPGSTHDAFMWSNCSLKDMFEQKEIGEGWLLGDSGYPCRPYLMTPVMNPMTRAEGRYNRAHRTTRCVVERAFGVWKSRFRCLHKSGGCLMFKPEYVVKIVVATAILHNICKDKNIPLPEDVEVEEEADEYEIPNDNEEDGATARGHLITNYFSVAQ